ncbi:hypothetical protein PG984_009740 [Apiospora sp. TS-2023a]
MLPMSMQVGDKDTLLEVFRNGIPDTKGLDELAKKHGAIVYNFTSWSHDEPSLPYRPKARKGTARGTTATRTPAVNTPAPTTPSKKPTNLRDVQVAKAEEPPSSPREIPVAQPASKDASCTPRRTADQSGTRQREPAQKGYQPGTPVR